MLAFVCSCLAASSAYILNDLLDLPADRVHPRKALEAIRVGGRADLVGIVLSGLLFVSAAALSQLLRPTFAALLAILSVDDNSLFNGPQAEAVRGCDHPWRPLYNSSHGRPRSDRASDSPIGCS